MMVNLRPFTGKIEDIEALGADYLPQSCGDSTCLCGLQYPYSLLAFVGHKWYLIGRTTTAQIALAALRALRKESGMSWKWKIRLSKGFKMILEIEKSQHICQTKKQEFHKEDLIPLPPGLEFLSQQN